MSRKTNIATLKTIKPFLSISMIILSGFLVVFVKMENRRLGYSLLKLSREIRNTMYDQQQLMMRFASLTRLDRVENYASTQLELQRAQPSQIIQVAGDRVVVEGTHQESHP